MNCATCGRSVSEHPLQWGYDPFVALHVSPEGCLFVGPGAPDPAAVRIFEPLQAFYSQAHGLAFATEAVGHSQNWDYVHPALRAVLLPLLEEIGVFLVSGHRTWEQQNYLYLGWLARKPGFYAANPPGISNHEAEPNEDASIVPWAALAVDLGGNKEDLANATVGVLHRPAAGEDWHFQLVGNASARFTGWGDAGHPDNWGPPPPPPAPLDPDELKGRTRMSPIGPVFATGVETLPVHNVGVDRFLDVAGGSVSDATPVIQWTWHGGDNQRVYVDWYDKTTNVCRLVFKHSGRVLDVSGAQDAKGARVIQFPWTGGQKNQLWRLEETEANVFRIHSEMPAGLVLDCNPDGHPEGVQLWTPHGGTNQSWRFS